MNWRLFSLVKAFKSPTRSLGHLDAEAAGALIAAATDLSLVVDAHGIIHDVAFQSDDLADELDTRSSWIGQRWVDTVTVESRPKVQALLRDASLATGSRWRHLNHPSPSGADVPVMYSAVPLGDDGRILAFGRDLRAVSALQQRLVNAQQTMERDYTRFQSGEIRYRMLFQVSSEAVLVIDAATERVVEANPAAEALLERDPGRASGGLLGRRLADAFEPSSMAGVGALIDTVRVGGRADSVRARMPGGRGFVVAASLFRQDGGSFMLVRLSPIPSEAIEVALSPDKSKLLKVVENAPDGFVVTGQDGTIVTANAAFLEMAELATEKLATGQPLGRWLGRAGVDLDVLIANLRQRGSMRLFATTLRSEFGTTAEVEISAVSVMNGGQPCYGFAIRNVARRISAETPGARELPRSVAQLTELIGRVTLKELVRESTDMIERLCIEAALELTGDNRASAAEMLGLSRQSLYVKLRRYGLGDLAADQ